MQRAIPADMTVVGWSVVAIGALSLAVVVLKFAPSNRAEPGPSTIAMGVAFVLCALGAAGAAIGLY